MLYLKEFINEEDGLGTIEMAILIAALVALAIAFRKQLKHFMELAATGVDNQSDEIGNPGKDFC